MFIKCMKMFKLPQTNNPNTSHHYSSAPFLSHCMSKTNRKRNVYLLLRGRIPGRVGHRVSQALSPVIIDGRGNY